jgi:parallel beta-helix repeat protein
MSYSNNNTITANNLILNDQGLSLDNSNSNVIYHNNFINNRRQVYDWSWDFPGKPSINTWDDGYPSGGNYWSDYNGTDFYSGPYQNETGSDGIGDTPYVIDENNQDNYPLMKPWTPQADTTPPETTISISGVLGDNGWFTSDVTVTLSATDDTEIDKTEYSFDNTTWITYVSPFTITYEGSTIIYYKSTDRANNVEKTKTKAIKIDKTIPSGSIAINDDATYTNSSLVTLTLLAEDITSGVAQMRFSNNHVDWSDWEPYATAKSWNMPPVDGERRVYVQFMDNAGLISTIYEDAIILDTAPPVADAGEDQTVAEDMLVTLDGSASIDENGIASYTWTFTDVTPQTLTGKNPTYNFTTPGTYIVTLTVTDPAGNTNSDTVTITVLLDTDKDQTPDVTDQDDDNDGMPDTWETENGLNPLDPADADLDLDGDGLTNLQEYQYGTNPNISVAEAIPIWALGVATAIIAIGIAVAATILWKKRK